MGTPCYVEAGLKDIDRYTYWIMPIYPVAQAVWYRLFSFSLASMRALSIFCGLLGLLAWTLFFRRLTGDDVGALLFMALMACDYINQSDIGVGRPDAMAFAFQAGAFAAYLHWRERNLRLAILLSQTLVVASGLTHPNGGMLSFLGALWLVLYFDRRRIRPAHVAIAAIPYVAGAIGWGAYIAQDPSAFVAQYGYQIATRSQILTAPWLAVRDELVRRYLTNMGLGGHSPGSYGPHYLKAVIFVAYAVSVAGLLAVPSLRQNRASRVLLGLIGIYFLFYTFLEGTKAAYYFIYLVYPYTAAVALFVRWCWRNSARMRPVLAVGLAGMFIIQAGGVAYRIRRDPYHREYLPAVDFLRAHAHPGDLIMGSHELGFTIGFRDNFEDDHLLGLRASAAAHLLIHIRPAGSASLLPGRRTIPDARPQSRAPAAHRIVSTNPARAAADNFRKLAQAGAAEPPIPARRCARAGCAPSKRPAHAFFPVFGAALWGWVAFLYSRTALS